MPAAPDDSNCVTTMKAKHVVLHPCSAKRKKTQTRSSSALGHVGAPPMRFTMFEKFDCKFLFLYGFTYYHSCHPGIFAPGHAGALCWCSTMWAECEAAGDSEVRALMLPWTPRGILPPRTVPKASSSRSSEVRYFSLLGYLN